MITKESFGVRHKPSGYFLKVFFYKEELNGVFVPDPFEMTLKETKIDLAEFLFKFRFRKDFSPFIDVEEKDCEWITVKVTMEYE